MKTAAALAAVLLLAACAIPPDRAVPLAATIGGDELRVSFSNGSVCRATLGPAGGQGTFACPEAASYAVTIEGRNLLEPLLNDAVAPRAEIAVTTVFGRTVRFRTPLSRDFPAGDAGEDE